MGQIKLQSIEIYTPRKDAAGKLMGIKQETVLYDPEAFAAPLRIVQNLDKLGDNNEGDPACSQRSGAAIGKILCYRRFRLARCDGYDRPQRGLGLILAVEDQRALSCAPRAAIVESPERHAINDVAML